MNEKSSSEFEENKPYNLDDLREIYKDIRQNNKTNELLGEKIKDLIDKDKSKFKHIFETDKGSVYFTTEDGSTVRFKLDEKKNWSIQPMTRNIFFLGNDEFQRLKDREAIVGEVFENSPFGVETRPLEIGIDGSPIIKFSDLGKGKVKIEGDEYGHLASGIHVGHQISKIIK